MKQSKNAKKENETIRDMVREQKNEIKKKMKP